MHGIIHRSLKEYVEEKMTDGAWDRVLERAEIEPKLYLPVSHYPDEEIPAIVDAITDLTGHEVAAVQRDFGRYIADELLHTFRAHLREDWDMLDVLEHLDEIYEQISAQNEESDPPEVSADRIVEDTLILTYRSDRRLCDFGKGIVLGMADEYGESVTIEEERCLHDGDDACEITVTRA